MLWGSWIVCFSSKKLVDQDNSSLHFPRHQVKHKPVNFPKKNKKKTDQMSVDFCSFFLLRLTKWCSFFFVLFFSFLCKVCLTLSRHAVLIKKKFDSCSQKRSMAEVLLCVWPLFISVGRTTWFHSHTRTIDTCSERGGGKTPSTHHSKHSFSPVGVFFFSFSLSFLVLFI